MCYSVLVHFFDSLAKSDSCLRRIQRFFAEFDLDHDLIARFLYTLLPGNGKNVLVIDRTNWKFGSTDINIFMLAVAHEGVDNPRKGDRAKAHWLFQGLKVGQTMCLPGDSLHQRAGLLPLRRACQGEGRDA